jgi:hypothetical protein
MTDGFFFVSISQTKIEHQQRKMMTVQQTRKRSVRSLVRSHVSEEELETTDGEEVDDLDCCWFSFVQPGLRFQVFINIVEPLDNLETQRYMYKY